MILNKIKQIYIRFNIKIFIQKILFLRIILEFQKLKFIEIFNIKVINKVHVKITFFK